MKKCVNCGLLNEDTIEACNSCGFTEFHHKPPDRRHPEHKPKGVLSRLQAERSGSMVTLKCRTPAEARLVRENFESAGVIALAPQEEQMLLQYKKNGYVEVQVPADAYDSTGDLRSVVEFSISGSDAGGLRFIQKLFAASLGVLIIPGLLIFAWLLTSYRKQGLQREAKEFKFWFLVGVGAWVLFILASLAFSL